MDYEVNEFMKVALIEGLSNIPAASRDGGPFGAVIVKDNIIIAQAHNEVGLKQDPTMHAEILAIQKAIKYLQINVPSRKRFDFLKGYDIYCTCFPCPMCLGAIYWSKIVNVYYGCSTIDAGQYSLGDDEIYKIVKKTAEANDMNEVNGYEIQKNNTNINFVQIDRDECLSLFEKWKYREKKQ